MSGMARKRRDKGSRYDGHDGARRAHGSHAPAAKKARATVTPQPAARGSQLALDDASGAETLPTREHAEAESDEYEEEDVAYEETAAEAEDEQDSVAEADVAEGGQPVVFQCGTCRSIFGDSFAFVGSNSDLLLITLSAVTSVTLSPEVHTSQQSADAGASFFELLCQNCQAVLGRKYLTTPVALDGIRDLYSFSTGDITSYYVGDPLQHADGQAGDPQQAAAACSLAMQKLSASSQELADMRQDIAKVQGVTVNLDERLAYLEAREQADSEEEAEEEVKPEAKGSSRRRAKHGV